MNQRRKDRTTKAVDFSNKVVHVFNKDSSSNSPKGTAYTEPILAPNMADDSQGPGTPKETAPTNAQPKVNADQVTPATNRPNEVVDGNVQQQQPQRLTEDDRPWMVMFLGTNEGKQASAYFKTLQRQKGKQAAELLLIRRYWAWRDQYVKSQRQGTIPSPSTTPRNPANTRRQRPSIYVPDPQVSNTVPDPSTSISNNAPDAQVSNDQGQSTPQNNSNGTPPPSQGNTLNGWLPFMQFTNPIPQRLRYTPSSGNAPGGASPGGNPPGWTPPGSTPPNQTPPGQTPPGGTPPSQPPSGGSPNGHGGRGYFPSNNNDPPDGDDDMFTTASDIPEIVRRPRAWKIKPSKDDYKTLRHIKDYTKWREHLIITTRSHGLSHLLRFDYAPETQAEQEDYEYASAWFYGMLRENVKTPTGEKIIRDNISNMYIPMILSLLHKDAQKSTHAIVGIRDLYQNIVTMRLDASYRGTLHSFIRLYEDRVLDYNTRVKEGEKISETMAKVHLRTAVSTCKPLNDVQVREAEMMVVAGREYDYGQYLQVLKHQATLQDTKNASKRSVNNHALDWQDPDDACTSAEHEDEVEVNQALSEYIINAAATERNTSRMTRSTWRSLTPEAQQIWDQLDDDSKSKILQGSSNKSATRPTRTNRKTQVNVMEQVDETTEELADEPTEDIIEDLEKDTIDINKTDAITKARDEAHPADTRKMMGSKKTTREANALKMQAFHIDYDEAIKNIDTNARYGLITSPKEWYTQTISEIYEDVQSSDSDEEDFRTGSW